jgi:hypothetical protein
LVVDFSAPGSRQIEEDIFLWDSFDFINRVVVRIISEHDALNLEPGFMYPTLLSISERKDTDLIIVLQQRLQLCFRTGDDTVILYRDVRMNFETYKTGYMCCWMCHLVFFVVMLFESDEDPLVMLPRKYFDG